MEQGALADLTEVPAGSKIPASCEWPASAETKRVLPTPALPSTATTAGGAVTVATSLARSSPAVGGTRVHPRLVGQMVVRRRIPTLRSQAHKTFIGVSIYRRDRLRPSAEGQADGAEFVVDVGKSGGSARRRTGAGGYSGGRCSYRRGEELWRP